MPCGLLRVGCVPTVIFSLLNNNTHLSNVPASNIRKTFGTEYNVDVISTLNNVASAAQRVVFREQTLPLITTFWHLPHKSKVSAFLFVFNSLDC